MRAPLWGLFLVGCASSTAPVAGPVVVAIAAADAGAPPPASVSDAPDGSAGDAAAGDGGADRENRRIARMMKRVSAKRELAALRVVPGVVLARSALLAKVKAHVEREVPPDTIANEGLELQLLGFVPESFDYLAETFKLLDAQLAGFYEPEDGTMYMAADLDEQNAEATLAHELTHALQDQHFDLKPHSKFVQGKSDEQASYDALAEGDATSAMLDVLVGSALKVPDETVAQGMLDGMSAGETADAPHIMRTSLVAPYVYGTLFVNALRRDGGWTAVDAAWKTLPTTTEQVLHVEKWRAHEPALEVAAPTFAALGAGWTAADEDTSGELGLRLAFEEWVGPERAKAAASGWGGDREELLANGDRAALAIHVRYDATRSGKAGDDPFTLLAAGLPGSVGKPAAKDATWICVERPRLGPLAVMKRGRDLAILVGPARRDAKSTRAAAGTCALARKWAREVVVE